MTTDVAKITITSGPDRGKVFELRDDLVHIGRDTDNQVVLTDPQLVPRQVSIARKNGRYAIYTSVAESVNVDESLLPPEKWVWLPTSARIRVGGRTSFQFTTEEGEGDSAGTATAPGAGTASGGAAAAGSGRELDSPSAAGTSPAARPRPAARDDKESPKEPQKKSPPGKKSEKGDKGAATEKGGRKVVRFVTDTGGDALVKLGEDGHLPELALVEDGQRRSAERGPSGGTSPWLYVGAGASVLLSLAMLLVDFESLGGAARARNDAREQIAEFYGDPQRDPLPYQVHLRQARIERSRSNRAGERREYRRVLDLLNAEDNNRFTGLTGSPERDDELRRLIGTLLGQ